MTDQTATATDKPLFVMAPTSDAYMQLVSQVSDLAGDVAELQAHTPATGGSDDDVPAVSEDELDAIHSRIDRHRAEIEEIKKRYNQLVRYLDASLAPAQPVSSQDTIQPQTRRDLIQ